MVRGPPAGFFVLSAFALFIWLILYIGNHGHPDPPLQKNPMASVPGPIPHITPETQRANPIMPRLGNETQKAELGRAAWKLFHTTMARFPDNPAEEESDALKSYIYLFARLYPCGECAEHFQKIIKKYPPQTSSRSTAAAWACHVHNEINKSKAKPLFDCSSIGDFYDCGCADDEEEVEQSVNPGSKPEMSEAGKVKMVQDGRDLNDDLVETVQIAREGPTRGG